MLTLADINAAYRAGSPEEKREFLELILPDINSIIDDRLFSVENDLIKIEEKIEHGVNIKPATEPERNVPVVPMTTLDFKASALVEHLQNNVKKNWGKEIVMCASDIYSFFTEKVKDSLRWPVDLKNKRQTKLEIIERAVKMYPDIVEIVRDSSGNKTQGIALKPSVKRINTDTC
jgi:hypothetical protein